MTSFGYVIPCPFTLLHLLPTFLSACYLETKVKSTFLLWHHHGDTSTAFQLKLANFLVTQPPFYDFVAKNLINFEVIETVK